MLAVSRRRRLLSATGGMAAITLASRLSGWARDKVIVSLLGAGLVSDAFYVGFRIPNMFRQLLAEGALQAAFVPTLAGLKESGDAARTRRFVRAMTSLLMLALPLIVLLGVVAAPLLVRLFAQAFSQTPEKYALTVRLTRLMFPYLGLISLAALAQGVLNTSDRFALPAATPIALNLCIIAGTVTTVEAFGGRAEWMAAGALAGGLGQFAMQWAACRRAGLPLLPGAGALTDPDVRRVLKLMLPTVTSLGIYPLTILLSTRFATSVGSGAMTSIYIASRVNELIYGVVIVQLTTALLPMLSAERLRDESAARATLGFALRVLSAVALPATAFSVAMALPLAGVLYGGGEYGAEAVHATAAALVMYSIGMPFLGLTKLLASTSFAWQDTRSPVLASVINLVAFFVLGVLLTRPYGVAGVAAATAGGQVANALTLLWLDGRHRRLPRVREVAPALARHLLAAAGIGVTLHLAQNVAPLHLATSLRSVALLLGYAAVGAAAYALLLIALRAPEWAELRAFLARRSRK